MRSGAVILAGLIFAILAIVHLLRIFYPFDVIIGDWSVPAWFSVVFFVAGGTLSAWLFRSLSDYL